MRGATSSAERWLVLILRAGGALTLSAFFAVFLPVDWMAATHRALGMGEFPASPLVDYLTRSVSVLYAFHGGLLLLLSTDVHRYRTLIVYIGASNLVIGLLLLGIDLHAGMPAWWTATEGPPVVVVGGLVLLLVRKLPSPAADH